eukprot:scaffold411453_cov52-Prasinocladus_malaysianus.AAC.1
MKCVPHTGPEFWRFWTGIMSPIVTPDGRTPLAFVGGFCCIKAARWARSCWAARNHSCLSRCS